MRKRSAGAPPNRTEGFRSFSQNGPDELDFLVANINAPRWSYDPTGLGADNDAPLGDLEPPCPEPNHSLSLGSCMKTNKNGPFYLLRRAGCYNQVKTLFRNGKRPLAATSATSPEIIEATQQARAARTGKHASGLSPKRFRPP